MCVGCLRLNPPNSAAEKVFFLNRVIPFWVMLTLALSLIAWKLQWLLVQIYLDTETNKEEYRTLKQFQNISKNFHPLHNIVAIKTIYIFLAAVNATLYYRAKYPAPQSVFESTTCDVETYTTHFPVPFGPIFKILFFEIFFNLFFYVR